MKRYMLLPEDSIALLPETEEAEAAVLVFCERTMIFFPCSKIEKLSIQKNVTEDRLRTEDCLQFTARDALFDTQQAVLVPLARQDCGRFLRALEAVRPELFTELEKENYVRETCDQTGSHLHAQK